MGLLSKARSKLSSSTESHEVIEVVLQRESKDTRLGIRLATSQQHGAPTVLEVVGVALQCGLVAGDCIMAVNGTQVHSPQETISYFSEAGLEIRLSVQRPFGSIKGPIRTMSAPPLGLPPSAPTTPLLPASESTPTLSPPVAIAAPMLPTPVVAPALEASSKAVSVTKGNGERTVTLARNDIGIGLVVDANNVTVDLVVGGAAGLPGKLRLGDKVLAVNGSRIPEGAPLVDYIPKGPAPFNLTLIYVGMPRMSRMSRGNHSELHQAFQLVGGSHEAPVEPAQTLAVLIHFDPSARLDDARALHVAHSTRADEHLDFGAFRTAVDAFAKRCDAAAPSLFRALDAKGLGVVSFEEARKQLHEILSVVNSPTAELDVAVMLGQLEAGEGGLLQREITEQRIAQILAC